MTPHTPRHPAAARTAVLRRAAPAALLLTLVLTGCARRPAKDQPNLLFITLDTTRADRLGCYGYAPAFTPNLDSLAAAGVTFEDAQSCVPITLPSHCTLFTGLTPPEHGVRVNGENVLPETIPTLAEILAQAGYRTGAVLASPVVAAHYGLNRGFQHYDDTMPAADTSASALLDHDMQNAPYRIGENVASAAIAWLEEAVKSDQPWFLWAHFYDPHQPWNPHHDRFGEHFEHAYDAEVAYMDQQVGRILDFMGKKGLKEKTIVLAVGDHGEGLGDNGESSHCFFIYRATQHVPLIITRKGAFKAGTRVSATLSLADIMPTLLDLITHPSKPYRPAKDPRNTLLAAMKERSFARALQGEALASRTCYMESLWPWYMFRWAPLYGLATQNHKYILAPEQELYDRLADPGETNNLATLKPQLTDDLAIDLERLQASFTQPKTTLATISAEELRALHSLGYTGGGGGGLTNLPSSTTGLTDVKHVKPIITLQGTVRSALKSDIRGETTLADALRLIETAPETALFQVWLGAVYDARQDQTNALACFSEALRLAPDSVPAHNSLAIFHAMRGRLGMAIPHFEAAWLAKPDDPALRDNLVKALETLGIALARSGDNAHALECFKRVVYLRPDLPASHLHLGHALAGLGQKAEAEAAYGEALRLQPGYPAAAQALEGLHK